MVKVGGCISDVSPVPSGIIHGFVLGPILFTVVEDSMLRCLRLSSVAFTDDVKFVADVAVRTREDVLIEVDAIVAWSDDHIMPLSIDKCLVLHCGRG